jgi:hypothetical protein
MQAMPIQLRGSPVARAALRVAGRTLRLDGLPAKQGVLIDHAHTSNWHFVLGIVTKCAVGVQVTFWGKDTLLAMALFGRSASSPSPVIRAPTSPRSSAACAKPGADGRSGRPLIRFEA